MELEAIYKRVIGLDIHQAQVSDCALIEQPDGTLQVERRQFGAFRRDRQAMAQWAAALAPDEVVMESTGIYWKSPYAALEAVGIRAKVVNARHVKNVPGRKTDIADAQWLATLARAGMCPGNNESAGKRKSGRMRQGNRYVRRLLCEFAHAASRTQCVFKSKFQALTVRRGHKRVIVAIGHKVLRTIFFMIKRGQCYQDSAVDYEALSVQRNAPRWIKALVKFGFITPAQA